MKGRHRAAKQKWQPLQNAAFPPNSFEEHDKHFVGVFINDQYQVIMREHPDKSVWLAIVRRDREPVTDWRHKQQIKNQLCGPEREAMEIYPAESRLVDTNNQSHLFVLPPEMTIPFGYSLRDVGDVPYGANKQRPFDEPPPDLNERRKDPSITVPIRSPKTE